MDAQVAIKILEKNRIVDRADVVRVSREIAILKVIRHPNVIQLYEIIETPKQLYLIMEYAEKGELFEYIVTHKRVDEPQARRFYRQIVSGLDYLHRLNVTHRDLKPENLLLDHQSNIKIVDFGLSNMCKEGDLLKTACGSPCYAPPEMVAGRKYRGPAADVWSSGVVLYAMLCGYLPFDDPNTANLYKKISLADYAIPKHVSPGARDLITRILQIDPAKRFTVADIRKHPWFAGGEAAFVLEPGIRVGMDAIPVDESVLDRLKNYGLDKERARIAIRENRHNALTSTYYLLWTCKNNASSLQNELMKTNERRSAATQKARGEPADEIDELESSFSFERSEFYEAKMGTKRRPNAPTSSKTVPRSNSDKDLASQRAPEPKVLPSKGDNESPVTTGRNQNQTLMVGSGEGRDGTVVQEEESGCDPHEEPIKNSVPATKEAETQQIVPTTRNVHKNLAPQTITLDQGKRPHSGATTVRHGKTSTIGQNSPHRHAMTLTEDGLLRASVGDTPQSARIKPITRPRPSVVSRVPAKGRDHSTAATKTKAEDEPTINSARCSTVAPGTRRPQTSKVVSKKYEMIKSELKCTFRVIHT